MNKILTVLPESIAGRLIISALANGFQANGFNVNIFDRLYEANETFKKLTNTKKYYFILSYDFVAIEYKVKFNINIPSVSYFADVINSDLSGKYWKTYYKYLKNPDNYVFYWDKVLTSELNKKLPNIYYLPLFVDTDIYRNLNIKKEYDIMFAGRLTFKNRLNTLKTVIENFPDKEIAIFSHKRHFEEAIKSLSRDNQKKFYNFYKGFIDTEEKMAEAINKSKVVINFTAQGKSNLNYRFFQTLACETMLLTDYRTEINELFNIDSNLICYRNEKDLIEKLKDYFKFPYKYKKTIIQARKIIENSYNNKIAAAKILETLNRD